MAKTAFQKMYELYRMGRQKPKQRVDVDRGLMRDAWNAALEHLATDIESTQMNQKDYARHAHSLMDTEDARIITAPRRHP